MASEQLIWMDGKLVPRAEARVSVYDHGLLYGDGVFEGLRIYNGRVLKMRTHLERLLDSARSIYLSIPYTIEQLEAAVRETMRCNERVNGYIRLIVTRGIGSLGVNPLQCTNPCTIIIIDDIEVYPPAAYENGLAIISAATVQKHPGSLSPRVKSLNYLTNMMAKLEALNAGAEEAVMFNAQGFVTECVGDNIFTVKTQQGELIINTPPAHAGLLEGVTMNLVIGMATDMGYDVRREDMSRHDLYVADEIFLTGTGAEVVPVVKIDGRPVGDGKPGEVTVKVMRAYWKLLESPPED